MITALFVSETWLKANTPINQNVEITTIVPFIGQAQDLRCQPVIGTALYERLMAGIVANNLTAAETTLLNLIRPALAYWTLAVALPFISVQVRNGGTVKVKSDNTEPASASEVAGLVTVALNTAEFYTERIIRYLCDNSSSFPEYSTSTDMTPNGSSPYNGGFIFPNDGGDSGCSSCGPGWVYR